MAHAEYLRNPAGTPRSARGVPIDKQTNFKQVCSRGGVRSGQVRREKRERMEAVKKAAKLICEERPPLAVLMKTGLVDYITAEQAREEKQHKSC